MEDYSRYGYKARIFSKGGKLLKTITDNENIEKINQCKRISALDHISKDILQDVERLFLPLKPYASSLHIETRGGNVISTMSLEDFLAIIEIAKRIEIQERYPETKQKEDEQFRSLEEDVNELLKRLEEN